MGHTVDGGFVRTVVNRHLYIVKVSIHTYVGFSIIFIVGCRIYLIIAVKVYETDKVEVKVIM